jgi:hypothetical protein
MAKLTFEIPADAKWVRCKSCNAWCVWIDTPRGKRMLVQAEGETHGESHFAHCPQAATFRRSRR